MSPSYQLYIGIWYLEANRYYRPLLHRDQLLNQPSDGRDLCLIDCKWHVWPLRRIRRARSFGADVLSLTVVPTNKAEAVDLGDANTVETVVCET